MSLVILKEKYWCDDYCDQCGCKGHEFTLQHQNTVDRYMFETDEGDEINLDQGAMDAMVALINRAYSRWQKEPAISKKRIENDD